ncbi:hypothetical protein [Burkholderia vietnamiensis]|uniref:hypothetical protein n=1 Tax=Burkholderia vietnamiensis TaxID=60552 RepID=UPI001592F014|nr:hypothetical protein [Burkholderia vietnamiensis]MBR8006559.1 hypothetical protein [Burkholderia vietnamiensis]MDN7814693.1 hypothetical protein [Burkholderia vietnamiensis]MDN8042361.1 hypothetical protein [Burkholderia vietnamiensis]
MKLILNVGLARNDGKPDNGVLRTVAVLNRCGFMLVHGEVQQSTTEATLVAEVRYTGMPGMHEHDLYGVCRALAQDCAAMAFVGFDGIVYGALHGPQADKWGAFDPQYFILPRQTEFA